MFGWILFGLGMLVLVRELWWQPRSMEKVRTRVARRGSVTRFDAYLGSRSYRWFRWWSIGAGVVLIVLGALVTTQAI